ncbi:50S ribosomal protein L11 methyltransferase [Tannerella sp.]|uniref:50S ribosomal protein L11 methyltransferase n=1 Tax=Tannerella sp. TaxID=2382127 RepID=UPI0026DA7809|nr:50S ribosomal protein L11 methyltransferase [Tannerella sp.]MDO4702850.1 50S ribosomal protein L11 methyltransferase [Tannerella sp.]
MDYYEFQFSYTSLVATEVINDILATELGTIGFESFVSDENGLKAYIPVSAFQPDTLTDCLSAFPLEETVIHHTHTPIAARNWNEEWEKNYFQPIRIGKQCLIRASFHKPEEGYEHTLVIDPRMAFGTGNHATTYLMLCEMLALDLRGKEVLDMGCGTAVLAILAARKHAQRVVAIDIDEWAYRNAIENCRLNNNPDIRIEQGGAECLPHFGTFDYIFANINRNILLNNIRHYVSVLKCGGQLYMSGFYEEDIPAIEKECRLNRLTLLSHTSRDQWVAVRTEKRHENTDGLNS